MAALLNTETVDRIFRCLSGSTAVSRFEMESVPLPPPNRLAALEKVRGDGDAAERVVRAAYEIDVPEVTQ
jgi:adenine-specific DNA-methyltransferase